MKIHAILTGLGITATSILVAVTMTACSSTTTGTTSTTSSSTSMPSRLAVPTVTQPAVHHLQIGEKASLGCRAGSSTECDVTFAITDIQPNVQCDDEYSPVGANQQMLRFDIEIWTAQQFADPNVDSAFFIKNWGIGDTEGVDNDLDDHAALRCEGGFGDQISKFLVPGSHLTKRIYVSAPKNATILRLYKEDRSGDGWTWDIPLPSG